MLELHEVTTSLDFHATPRSVAAGVSAGASAVVAAGEAADANGVATFAAGVATRVATGVAGGGDGGAAAAGWSLTPNNLRMSVLALFASPAFNERRHARPTLLSNVLSSKPLRLPLAISRRQLASSLPCLSVPATPCPQGNNLLNPKCLTFCPSRTN